MRRRIIVIMTSSILAFFIMSGGYGLWRRTLKIEGTIHVEQPRGGTTDHSFASMSMENAESVIENVYSKKIEYDTKTVSQDVYSSDDITDERIEFGDIDVLEFIEDYQMPKD